MERSSGISNWSTGGGLAAIVLWSITIAVVRSLSERTGPLTVGAGVYLIGGVVCLLRLAWQGTAVQRLRKLPRPYLLGCGSLFVLYTVVLYLAVGSAADRQQVLEVGLVNYLWPAGTILFSLLLLDKRAGPLLVPGTVLALAGEFLVLTQDARVSWHSFAAHLQANPTAYALAFLAAVAWSLYSTLARRWSQPGTGGGVEVFIPAAGLALLVLHLFATEAATWSARAAAEALVLGVVTALAYALWDVAMRRGNLLLVAACSYFTPLLSTLVSCLYLHVTPGLQLWAGCLLLVAGSLLTWLSVSDRPPGTSLRSAERFCGGTSTAGPARR